MIFPTVALLALVTLFVTPISSAPVYIPNTNADVTEPQFPHQMFAKGPPIPLGHPPRHAISNLPKRDRSESVGSFTHINSLLLHTGSIDGIAESPLARVTKNERPRLVRRKSIFTKIKEGFRKVGHAIKKGFQKVGQGIKKIAKKVGNGIKTGKFYNSAPDALPPFSESPQSAAKKVGKFIKNTGAKIAKFGLKVLATATKVAGRVASFIPVIGKPIGKALNGVSKVQNLASDKIHAKLGKKLEKGMKIMNRIQNPVGGVTGKVLDAVFKRDVNEERLFERDLPELETYSFEDGDGLEARSFEGEKIEACSFDDAYELEARSFEDSQELEARSWDFEEDEA